LKVSSALGLLVKSCFLPLRFFWGRACLEPEAVVTGFQDMAVMGEAIEQRGRHLGIPDQRMMPLSLMSWCPKSGLFLDAMAYLARSFPLSL
jgi:hypothetical protein